MTALLLGLLMALVGLMIALAVANLVIFILLHDLPWLRLFRGLHDVETFRNVPYVHGSADAKHRADIFRPKGKKGYPMVVFVHGGYWTSGDKEYYLPFTGLYANVGIALARHGIGVAVVNYRLAPGAKFDQILADVTAAVAWMKSTAKDYDADPASLWLMGHAAGAHLITLLASDPRPLKEVGVAVEDLKGFVAMSAIYDLEDMAKKNDASFNEAVVRATFGADPSALSRYSPISHFRLGMPTMLMLTGEKDFPYLIAQEEAARRKLDDLQASPTAYVIPGYTHMDMVLKFGRDEDEVSRRVIDFILGRASSEK